MQLKNDECGEASHRMDIEVEDDYYEGGERGGSKMCRRRPILWVMMIIWRWGGDIKEEKEEANIMGYDDDLEMGRGHKRGGSEG